MGVFSQILINKPIEGVFKPGQTVSGVIKYAIDEPTEYKQVIVSLLGDGKSSWTETASYINQDYFSSATYTGTEEYVSEQLQMLTVENTTINVGSYEFPFQFVLPHNIPSSVKNSTCTIKYRIEVKFIRPGIFSMNKIFDSEFTVYGYVTPIRPDGPVQFGVQKSVSKLFTFETQLITLIAVINKTTLAPGEHAVLKYVVSNDSDTSITSMNTSLVCTTIYKANWGKTKTVTETINESVFMLPSASEKGKSEIRAVIPIFPNLYSIHHSKIMVREYKVLVTIVLPLLHFNGTAQIPIVIGERPDSASSVDIEYIDPSDDEDKPPSYDDVMLADGDNVKRNG